MQNVVIGKRIVPVAHIALIEAFDAEANPRFQPTQQFRSRVVLLNRDSILALQPVEEMAKAHGFRFLADDQVATNPAIYFAVETFAPAEGFVPSKPFQTRLRWRDHEGNDQSKLLLTKPEMTLAAVTGETVATEHAETDKPERVNRRKARRADRVPATQP